MEKMGEKWYVRGEEESKKEGLVRSK